MYIDPHLSAVRLPARSPQPRFTARPLASSLVVHGAVAAALLLFAHRAMLPAAPETPPIPMVFLPPAPPPAPPAPPVPPPQAEPTTPPEAQAPPPPLEQPVPAPLPEVTRAPPPPVQHETRPERPRPLPRVRHTVSRPHPVPREQPTTTAKPQPPSPPAPAAIAPSPVASAPVIPPRPLTEAAGNRPPFYPDRAKRDHEQGRVILRVDVSAEGRAAGVAILRTSGFPDLDQSAAEAVRSWRFIPASRAGQPVSGVAQVPVSFTLADQ
jgi:protein TonB